VVGQAAGRKSKGEEEYRCEHRRAHEFSAEKQAGVFGKAGLVDLLPAEKMGNHRKPPCELVVADVRESRLYQIAQFRYNAESRRCGSAALPA
jgi:hypothetical protein